MPAYARTALLQLVARIRFVLRPAMLAHLFITSLFNMCSLDGFFVELSMLLRKDLSLSTRANVSVFQTSPPRSDGFLRLLRPAMLAHQIMTNRSGFAPSGTVVVSHEVKKWIRTFW
jgi:hypothetical protein